MSARGESDLPGAASGPEEQQQEGSRCDPGRQIDVGTYPGDGARDGGRGATPFPAGTKRGQRRQIQDRCDENQDPGPPRKDEVPPQAREDQTGERPAAARKKRASAKHRRHD